MWPSLQGAKNVCGLGVTNLRQTAATSVSSRVSCHERFLRCACHGAISLGAKVLSLPALQLHKRPQVKLQSPDASDDCSPPLGWNIALMGLAIRK